MATQPTPSQPGNLHLFADAVESAAMHYKNAVHSKETTATELAQGLKALKLLVSLCDGEVKYFRRKK